MNEHLEIILKENSETKKDPKKEEENEPVEKPRIPESQKACKKIFLNAIFNEIHSNEKEWPKVVFKAVAERFGRMPRFGWSQAHATYCGRFNVQIPLTTFKGLATRDSCREQNENAKRLKTGSSTLYGTTLSEAKLFNEVKAIFLEILGKLKLNEIDKAERTRKIPSEKVNFDLLETIVRVVGEYVQTNPQSSMALIAKTIQAAQLTYQRASEKHSKASNWRSSIENKIKIWKDLITNLERSKRFEKLSKEEKRSLQNFMVQEKLKLGNSLDATEGISRLNEKILIFKKKLEMQEKRKQFTLENKNFELYRRSFYRSLSEGNQAENKIPVEEVKEFWSNMWEARNDKCEDHSLDEYVLDHVEPEETVTFPSSDEFLQTVRFLPNWKAAGPDGIYNFFIKKLTPLHSYLYDACKSICLNSSKEEKWFYKGLTYLIPKGEPKKGSDFRPITCMSNLYKLTTKCVTQVMQTIVESRNILSENQLGTVRMVQGAKEQALINIAVNKHHKNKLKTSWIDVKKAFDSVDHVYLIKCIKSLKFPEWITDFLEHNISNWTIEIRNNGEAILEKKMKRGILQGDSLSPLLFVLCMDPLSRKLNAKYQKVEVETATGTYITNHLLFIDDLKLLATSEEELERMMNETKSFFQAVGLELNKEKSATNSITCQEDATLMESKDSYKYLGIIETADSKVSKDSFLKIKNEILSRVKRLCQRKLNAKNLFKAINEHAISVINYQVGVLKLEPEEYAKLDEEIRKILIENHVHMQPGNKERLYLGRDELGRGLANVEHKSENMLLELKNTLEKSKYSSLRRAAILKVEEEAKSHLFFIEGYLKEKYKLNEEVSKQILWEVQRQSLKTEITKKTLHERLFRAYNHELVDIKSSGHWLKKGNVKARDEAVLCYLQDRNIFLGQQAKCPHCKAASKTVEHLATKCDRMLGHDYTRRHNEVVRCIHLSLCNKYGIKKSKKLRNHSVQEVLANEKAEIRVDTRIKTDIKIKHDRPDIFIHDKIRNEITLIEIGITNLDLLTQVENEKTRKYDLVANEISLMYNCKVKIIPYVLTWEGLVTKYHKNYVKELELSSKTEAYIQFLVLKKTLESISFERRRGLEEKDEFEEISALAEKLMEKQGEETATTSSPKEEK